MVVLCSLCAVHGAVGGFVSTDPTAEELERGVPVWRCPECVRITDPRVNKKQIGLNKVREMRVALFDLHSLLSHARVFTVSGFNDCEYLG